MRSWISVVLFCSFAVAGYKFAVRSWDGITYVYLGDHRAPASTRELDQYTAVNGESIELPPAAQLIRSATVEHRQGALGIYLGNPLLRTPFGFEFACRVPDREGLFNRMELIFQGVGVSTSGDSPELIVDSPCESRDEAWLLEPIWLPLAQILAQPPRNAEFQTDTEPVIKIDLRHMPDEWPPEWVLARVTFYNTESGEEALEIGGAQMRNARASLLSFTAQP